MALAYSAVFKGMSPEPKWLYWPPAVSSPMKSFMPVPEPETRGHRERRRRSVQSPGSRKSRALSCHFFGGKSDATRLGHDGLAGARSRRTDGAVGHGDGRARALLHQVHDLPEELAGVGGPRAVQLVVLRRNAGGGDADREGHEQGGGGGTRHGVVRFGWIRRRSRESLRASARGVTRSTGLFL